jgi:hypothetical protein
MSVVGKPHRVLLFVALLGLLAYWALTALPARADAGVHVGDLDGNAGVASATWWRPGVRIIVHGPTHAPVPGAVVTGTWSTPDSPTVSCTTRADGGCTVVARRLPLDLPNVTFNVTGVTQPGASYDSDSNHDPDADSTGDFIVLSRGPAASPATGPGPRRAPVIGEAPCTSPYQAVGQPPFTFTRTAANRAALDQAAARIHEPFVFLTIGHSITQQISRSAEREWLPTVAGRNPDMAMISGAAAGVNAGQWSDPNHPVWQVVEDRLQHRGMTAAQVRVIWLKTAYNDTKDDYNARLVSAMEQILANLKAHFPNLEIVYVSPHMRRWTFDVRVPSGEPTAHGTGAAIQEFVTRHAADARPAVTYGPYLWSDDPAVWQATDYITDCLHLTDAGESKAGKMVIDAFAADPSAAPWFLGRRAEITYVVALPYIARAAPPS